MENKLVSLILKVGMGVLFILGVVLIWNNLSLAPNADEDIALTDQEFFKVEHELPLDENGKRQDNFVEVFYSVVLNAKDGEVYDLEADKVYEYQAYVDSKGEDKVEIGNLEEGMVNEVVMETYEFQGATIRSINYTKWLMILAFAVILIFTVVNVIKNPKRFLVSAVGLTVLAIICFVGYSMADTAGDAKMMEVANYSDTAFRYTGAGVTITVILALIAIGLILYQSVINLLRIFSK